MGGMLVFLLDMNLLELHVDSRLYVQVFENKKKKNTFHYCTFDTTHDQYESKREEG